MHTSDARRAGETEQRLHLLAAWEEAFCYTDRERAALAWTDHLTQIGTRRAPDAVYAELKAHFTDEEQVKLDPWPSTSSTAGTGSRSASRATTRAWAGSGDSPARESHHALASPPLAASPPLTSANTPSPLRHRPSARTARAADRASTHLAAAISANTPNRRYDVAHRREMPSPLTPRPTRVASTASAPGETTPSARAVAQRPHVEHRTGEPFTQARRNMLSSARAHVRARMRGWRAQAPPCSRSPHR